MPRRPLLFREERTYLRQRPVCTPAIRLSLLLPRYADHKRLALVLYPDDQRSGRAGMCVLGAIRHVRSHVVHFASLYGARADAIHLECHRTLDDVDKLVAVGVCMPRKLLVRPPVGHEEQCFLAGNVDEVGRQIWLGAFRTMRVITWRASGSVPRVLQPLKAVSGQTRPSRAFWRRRSRRGPCRYSQA